MKTKMPVRDRKALNSKLAVYSATATAALLAAPVAHATIQNITGLNVSLSFDPYYTAAHTSFTAGPFQGYVLNRGFDRASNSVANYLSWLQQTANEALVAGGANVARLNFGDAIVGQGFQVRGLIAANRAYTSSTFQLGNFTPSHHSGYIAIKSGSHSSYYGWLKINVGFNGSNHPNQLTLIDNGAGIFGAFDKASDIVTDNFTVGSVAPVPEPSTAAISGLGLLALGAQGVRELRRRRKQEGKI